MDDRIKESISALLDNEADELELRRVLNHVDNDGIKAVWSRYSVVSSLMSSGQFSYSHAQENRPVDSDNGLLDIDISSQISRSIDRLEEADEPVLENDLQDRQRPVVNKKRVGLLSTVAIAATVMMAISLVFKPMNDVNLNDEAWIAQNGALKVDEVAVSSDINGVVSESKSFSGYVANVSNADDIPLVKQPFSPEHASKLNQYLLRHAENSVAGGRSGVMPLARVASFTIAKN
ncbi:sigma-E factor negative regulatory protein [Alkalimarinus sediminis]|uniref:Sigma-E factor negative regulatory protein n=1 Tax=Alkalimarinus sediminis TaxID=1632866 RepID=A0A9E8HHL8_9ALTE|nr:sigma-E factor negative regulatory protein [Alkalimarinus sediminis]UZW73512.1 sigma-E factor negative regulatory protein [Alkalimarinus sediminis]